MVLKPLSVGTERFGAARGLDVFEVDDSFPAGFHAERVAVSLREVVGEVHEVLRIFEPKDGPSVVGAEVAGAVELDEATNDGDLIGIFGKGDGSFEVLDEP